MKHIDCWLYGGMAACTALTASFQTDEAMNYISAPVLWYSRTIITTIGAVLLAIKTYRSTAYAQSITTTSVGDKQVAGVEATQTKQTNEKTTV